MRGFEIWAILIVMGFSSFSVAYAKTVSCATSGNVGHV